MSQQHESMSTIARIDALDALRASIMILGVFLHGAVAYMHVPLPGLLWPVRDPSQGWVFDLVLWYIHGFRIPLFFMASGFFAALLCDLRGLDAYLVHRIKRIAVPLAVAILVILPPTYYLWGLGLVEQGLVTWREVTRMSFHNQELKDQVLGLAHLWFLHYLLIYCIVYYLVRKFFPALLRFPRRIRLLESWWWPLSLVAVTFPLLWMRPEIYTQFDNRWLPDPWGLTYHALFFLVGTYLFRVHDQLNRLLRVGYLYILTSLVVFAAVILLFRWQLSGNLPSHGTTWAFALATSLYSWLAVWGFLGVCLMAFSRQSTLIRYLSDAAYWIYLVHLPVIVSIQLTLEYAQNRGGFSIPPGVGFLISVSLTLAIALLSYQYLVRYGSIGKWLHGPKNKDMGTKTIDRSLLEGSKVKTGN
jgi:peptidoglycan/LPS O-acetylase OafA/YrhL